MAIRLYLDEYTWIIEFWPDDTEEVCGLLRFNGTVARSAFKEAMDRARKAGWYDINRWRKLMEGKEASDTVGEVGLRDERYKISYRWTDFSSPYQGCPYDVRPYDIAGKEPTYSELNRRMTVYGEWLYESTCM